ncbi:peroxisomal-coenzyme a synthetase [Diplodia corticola]|uniref:Peroxisomal-coenzyme a synthetase n=1 Tax=Diplodia corticola TaxID=236234 RepID=A0A1J9RNA8_9PEZI|nr:peroxisomal-coenzyme a synthetase [Diplodia corticola]OJD29412.1 peroxisomal-coenzyme a synthetase [Diplodia corticola]
MSTLASCLHRGFDSSAVVIPGKNFDTNISHRDLARRVREFQLNLAAIGITHGSRVAFSLPNSLELIVAFFASTCMRAVAAPLNFDYKQSEFEFYLQDLDAAVLIVPFGSLDANTEAVKAARARGVRVAEVSFNGGEIVFSAPTRTTAGGVSRLNQLEAQPDDVALILHTSGTTGRPKAVPLTHRNLTASIKNIHHTYRLTPRDRGLVVMPLFHIHGLVAGTLAPLAAGGSVVVPPRFSASDFWPHFVAHAANWYTAVPTIHQILLKHPLPSPPPRNIRFVRSCSSPLPPTVLAQLERALRTVVLEAYAMTEAAHQMCSNPLPSAGQGPRLPGSVGQPQGGVQLRIKDDSGADVAAGEVGEVCVRGENVTSGYLVPDGDDAEAARAALDAATFTADGFLRTGDQGVLDAAGYLRLTGRIKELINKGGEKISPIELDNLLLQHPAVGEAVSFAVDDALYGQDVGVAVVLKKGERLGEDEVRAFFRERAARFKVPKKVYFTETMPKTATGKIQRRQVAAAMTRMEALNVPTAPIVHQQIKEQVNKDQPMMQVCQAALVRC